MNEYDMTSRAFSNALICERLSSDSRADNYVGDYAYIGKGSDGEDIFKHIDTRRDLE